ncbi:type II secretion system F family protein [Sporomusa sp.]|uniref:type II secretion system F family protein n=1 Tax=Sporomusa sp. TaxID=2078658 RepID=UPI002B83FF56|nr:type II secretion system F family protein [Sporomusa sp.]HWR44659.1 type II secretion system F family protein [Sporomusa sp.]
MLPLIGIALFLNLLVVCLLLYRWQTHDREAVGQRLGHYVKQAADVTSQAAVQRAAARELTGWRALIRQLSKLLELSDGSWSRGVEHRLIQAGLPLKTSELLVICLGTTFAGAVLCLLKGGLTGAVVGGVIGYLAPFLFLRIKIKRRARAFNAQLGDTLILIANALRTGYSFMQSIEMVAREMLPPISVEFGRTLKEMNLGVPTEEAMSNMAKRVDSDDLDLAITAVLIQRQVGGNLAEVLDNIAATIRERIRIKGQIKTLTAQGRMSGIIVSLLPVAMLLLLQVLNPGYSNILFTHPTGQLMLGAAVGGQLLGIVAIQKIVNIDI